MAKKTIEGTGRLSGTLGQARRLHQAGQLREAAAVWSHVLSEDPQCIEAYVAIGDIAFRFGNPTEAMRCLDQIDRLSPGHPQATLMRAQAMRLSRRLLEARALLDRFLVARPRDSQALKLRAAISSDLGEIEAAIRDYRKALRLKKDDIEAVIGLGAALMRSGEINEGLPLFNRAVALSPRNPIIHLNQAQALLDSGLPERALAAAEKASRLAPDFVPALVMKARALDALCHFNAARAAWLDAAAKAPDDPNVLNDAATFLVYDNELPQALDLIQKAVSLAPKAAPLRDNYVAFLIADGRLDDAEEETRSRLSDEGDTPSLNRTLGDILVRKGDFTGAQAVLTEAMDRFPSDDGLAIAFVATGKMTDTQPAASRILERAQGALAMGEISPDLAYAGGKIADDRSDVELAFRLYKTANDQRCVENPFDIDGFESFVDDLIQVYKPALFAELSPIGSPSTVPIFVVGLPRSGTTLTEQIIASHSAAAGAGELTHFTRLEQSLAWVAGDGGHAYPSCMGGLNQGAVSDFADKYVSALDRIGNGASHVVDKLPNNFLRLGLLKVVFPRAKVVHMNRDLRDTALSLYFQNFTYGHGYRHDLDVLGRYLRATERLMAHWRNVIPDGFFDLDYAALVKDPEAESKKLFAYLDLPWEPDVLNFHRRREQPVGTASRWQVRQPVTTGSVAKWERYGQFLEPLLKYL